MHKKTSDLETSTQSSPGVVYNKMADDTWEKQIFYAEIKRSRQNIYSGELGLLQYPGNALFSVQKQNVTTSRTFKQATGTMIPLVYVGSMVI